MTTRKKIRKQGPGTDSTLLFSVFLLLGIGIIMVYSAGSAVAAGRYGEASYFAVRQLVFAGMGMGGLLLLRQINYRLLSALAWPVLGLAFLLLVLVFVPGLGVTVGGATRWLDLGPVNFQPAEYARFALVVYLAHFLSRKDRDMEAFWPGVGWPLAVTGALTGLLLLQPDFGSAVLLCATCLVMLFVGGAKIRHLAMVSSAVLPLAGAAVLLAPYRMRRFMAFLNPDADPLGAGYHINHSLMAFGSGGLAGVGVGGGYQKLHYLPEPHTDFILAVLGEEMGLLGVCVVVGLFCIVIWRGLRLARNVEDPFASYLAFGLSASIGLCAVVNMGVTMGLLPTKGLTLPFISYGGSSLLFSLACVGVLASVARVHGVKPVALPLPGAMRRESARGEAAS
ncbi:MAG: putative lipid II flippase FtsW [Deltaproteobacteria bacterium]|nr:putative lipid II flippase FtsW [Deltaproteobacteria bacterium]